MTVSSPTSRNDYEGNGVTTLFPVTFRFLENSHLKVLRTVIATGISTTLTLDSVGPNGYTVVGAQQPSGGQVTTNVAPALGERLSILRDVPVTQETDYLANDPFPAETHERALDKLTMIVQQQAEVTARAIVLPPQTVGVSTQLPGAVPLNLLRWNAAATAIENAVPPQIATVADGAVVDATVSPIAGIQATKLAFQQGGANARVRDVQDKDREDVSVADYFGSATQQVQSALNYTGPRRDALHAPAGTFSVTSIANDSGRRIDGPGIVVYTPPSGLNDNRLVNSYADWLTHDVGKEYLYRFHEKIYNGQATKTYLYGDSTVAGDNSTGRFRPEGVLGDNFRNAGLSTCSIVNLGVGGTNASQFDPSVALADPDTNMLIISYGINDGGLSPAGDAIELFYTNMATKLAAIRAVKDIRNLTIVLKGSNSTNDWAGMRNQVWHERISGVYRRLAREFQCYFFDTYALWNDSSREGAWLDAVPYHIHPNNLGNAWIWGKLAHELVPPSLDQVLYNNFINISSVDGSLLASAAPDTFPYGLSVYRCLPANGWPVDGYVRVLRSADGVVSQECHGFNINRPYKSIRGGLSGNIWSEFSLVPIAPSLQNGWTNYGAGWDTAAYYFNGDGEVVLSGLIKPSGAITSATIFTLPTQYRPVGNKVFELSCDTGRLQLQVTSAGLVAPLTFSGTPNFVSLDGVRFLIR